MIFAMPNLTPALPEIFVLIMASLILVVDLFLSDKNRFVSYALTQLTLLGAAYTLWMYKRVIFGAVANDHVAHLRDIGAREKLVFVILAVCVLGMGLIPLPFADIMHTSVNDLLVHLATPKVLN